MKPNQDTIRALLIEHNPFLLEGLYKLLSESAEMEVAGVAGSGAAGLALFEQIRPSVTILDLELPDLPAEEIVRRIRKIDPRTPVLILATYELDPAGAAAIEAGASTVIAKDQIGVVLLSLIHSLCGR